MRNARNAHRLLVLSLLSCAHAGAAIAIGASIVEPPGALSVLGISNAQAQDAQSELGGSTSGFTVTSPDFEDGGVFPDEFRCEGRLDRGTSPPLAWSGVPEGTKSFAVQLRDKARSSVRVYWLLYDLAPDVRSLPRGIPLGNAISEPVSARQAQNEYRSAVEYGYRGPCTEVKDYEISIHALDVPVLPGVPSNGFAADVIDVVGQHELGVARIAFEASRRGFVEH